MFSSLRSFGLPLLFKELSEQAAQRRTYIVRLIYGLLLFGGGLLLIYGSGGSIDSTASLGQGRVMFQQVVSLQIVAILLFLPAMTAGSIAGEKERDSLALLLLTTMPPTTILLQKLLSRVIPMLSLVILSFPLMAAAYSFGGVRQEDFLSACIMLVLGVLQFAVISLTASAFCRTTVEALLLTYLGIGAHYLFFGFLMPFRFVGGAGTAMLVVNDAQPYRVTVILILAAMVFLLGRVFLISRAFVPPSNLLMQLFQGLDSFWNEWNAASGGVVLVDDKNKLPNKNPIAWRETAKKSLGTFRYLFRVLVVLETPVLFTAQLMNISAVNSRSALSYLALIIWAIGGVLICIHAANVISSERSKQTLDVLLTTPMTGDVILKEKLAGVWRLMLVILVPLLTIAIVNHWFLDYGWNVSYLARGVGFAIIFLTTLVWLCAWIGLKNRSQLRAIFTAIGSIAFICFLPLLLSYVAANALRWNSIWVTRLTLLSPAVLVSQSEFNSEIELQQFGVTAIQFEFVGWGAIVLAAICGWSIRRHCLLHADDLLKRMPDEGLVWLTDPQELEQKPDSPLPDVATAGT